LLCDEAHRVFLLESEAWRQSSEPARGAPQGDTTL
jgi:hypothetical protein